MQKASAVNALPPKILHTQFARQLKFVDSLGNSFAATKEKSIKDLYQFYKSQADAVNDYQLVAIFELKRIKTEFEHTENKKSLIAELEILQKQCISLGSIALQAETEQILGRVLWDLQKQSQALEQFIAAYNNYIAIPASEFPNKADFMCDYAGKYYFFRDFKTCATIMRKVFLEIDSQYIGGRISKLNTLALCYNYSGNYDSAMLIYNQALLAAKKNNEEIWVGIITGNIGAIYFEQKQYEKALELMFANIALSEKHHQMIDLAFSYMRVGEIYMIQHRNAEALNYLRKSLKIVRVKNLNNKPEIVSRIYIALGRAYAINGMQDSAAHFLDSGWVAKDTANARRNILFLTGIQRKLEIEKHKAELSEKELQLSHQRKISFAILSGLVLASVFGFVLYKQKKRINIEKKRSDDLLLNILPAEIAQELKTKGYAHAKDFGNVTILFTDFKDFTKSAEKMSAGALIKELDYCFKKFDEITAKYKIEKIKTIGDSYMCAAGLPVENESHAGDAVMAAIEIRDFIEAEMKRKQALGELFFEIRIGLNSGPVIAGIIGIKKFAYDIWGDTVNIASRMESSGEPGKINISGSTYELVKDEFNCVYRGKVKAKNKGEIDMYFVESIKK
jgi:class 3 adenylate cyclase/Tfp pilus assembly protein PilF